MYVYTTTLCTENCRGKICPLNTIKQNVLEILPEEWLILQLAELSYLALRTALNIRITRCMLIGPSLKASISWSSKIGPIEVLNDNLLFLLLCEPRAYSIKYN